MSITLSYKQPNTRGSASAIIIVSHEDARTYIYRYIGTSAIFMDIGKLGYNKPFEIYMRLAPRPLDAKIILEQILRTNQKSYFKVRDLCKAMIPGSPARDTSMHSFWPTFDGFSPGISLSIKGVIPHHQPCILKTVSPHSTCLNPTSRRVTGMCRTRVNKWPAELC